VVYVDSDAILDDVLGDVEEAPAQALGAVPQVPSTSYLLLAARPHHRKIPRHHF
jgi:hypothetical protein